MVKKINKMSRHKVSRGNTSDLIGLWNDRVAKSSTIEAPKQNNLLSVNPHNFGPQKFRKTSAFVPKVEEPLKDDLKFRKTSAMVLMPTQKRDKSPTRSLNVDSTSSSEFKPLKVVSGLENGSAELPKLRSALKLSTIEAPKIQTESGFLDVNNNGNRRGSVGLGRSKSVCHKVKFVPSHHGGASDEGYGRPTPTNSPFAKFHQMDNHQGSSGAQGPAQNSRLTRQASLPSLNEKNVSAPPPVSSSQKEGGNGGGLRRSTVVARSPSSAKEVILTWVQERTNTSSYPNLNVTNFSTSWNDGMAFCALIHYYYPEAFDYSKLDPKNRRYNFDLAFKTAEQYADICPLLDVEDMVMFEKPDWKCVFTYVQTFFRRFRNGRDPPVPTKKLTLTPPTPAPAINKSIN